MNANRTSLDGAPIPDLSGFCLEADEMDRLRPLAWMNTICFIYVLIGVFGLKSAAIVIDRKPPSADDAVPVIIEPPASSPHTANPETPDALATEQADEQTKPVVAVTLNSAAVAFSVPTLGNVLVPLNMAQAPPPNSLQDNAVAAHIEQIGVTGMAGSRPPPRYPEDALARGEQGTVVLLIEVDDKGRITSVTVRESSGSASLDQAAVEQVQGHWFFDTGPTHRTYLSPIVFQLQ